MGGRIDSETIFSRVGEAYIKSVGKGKMRDIFHHIQCLRKFTRQQQLRYFENHSFAS